MELRGGFEAETANWRAIAIRMVFKAMSLEVTMGVREEREKEDQRLSPQIPQSYEVREKGIIQ